MDIKELGPIGAELTDIDLKNLSNEDVARIKIYFLDHSVTVSYTHLTLPTILLV